MPRPTRGTSSLPRRSCLTRWLTPVVLLALLAMFTTTTGRAAAQTLSATGDGQNMWVVLPEADKGLTILHRKAQDAPGHFWKVTTFPGLLSPGGTAAGFQKLWLVYNTMMVQSIELGTDPAMPQARYSQASFLSSLPRDATLRSLAGSQTGVWALIDVKTPEALDALDNPDTSLSSDDDDGDDDLIIYPTTAAADDDQSETSRSNKPAVGKSANAQADTAKSAEAQSTDARQADPSAAAANKPFEKPVARLARNYRGSWETLALPEDWSVDNRAWVVVPQLAEDYPTLIAEPQAGAKGLVVYQYDGSAWSSTTYATPGQTREVTFLSLQQQIVMAARDVENDKMLVTLWVLRPERKEVVQIGQIAIDQPANTNWGIAADGLSATLLVQSGVNPPVAASINLMGQITHPPAPAVIEQHPKFVQNPGQMLLVGVVAVSIFLMFVIWRRDPNLDDVTLPKNMVLADFGRRLGAAAIDLGPCIFIAMLATGVDLSKLQHDWPGRTGSWYSMIPGFITIGLFILHTGLSEMFTGKTLGKAICGIQVISTTGGPPNIWQIIARNALKAFDLIAFYILPVLALVGKHRQRLGDLVGKTLVVKATELQPPDELVEELQPGQSEKKQASSKTSDDSRDDNDPDNDADNKDNDSKDDTAK